MGFLLLAAENTTNVTAKNPIIPQGKEILWGSISFLIVLALLWKFAFPAIKKALADREQIDLTVVGPELDDRGEKTFIAHARPLCGARELDRSSSFHSHECAVIERAQSGRR